MSWTNECTESNLFKVKNPQEVREVLELMGFNVYESEDGTCFATSGEGTFFDEDAEVVLSLKPVNNKNLIGIISDFCNDSVDLESIGDEFGEAQEELMVVSITEYLQDQLLDDKQYITVTCAGFESRSSGSFSPFGDITVITKNSTKFMSLSRAIDNILKEETLAN